VRNGVLFYAAALVLAVGGCGSKQRAEVSGRITLDGEPLASGTINFFPTEGNRGPTAGGIVADGRYHIAGAKGVVRGKNRVAIRGSQKTGRQIVNRDGDATDEVAEIVPAKYNLKTTLVRDVQPETNNLDFDLQGRLPIEKTRRKYPGQ
jgi:hypothetical protein